MSIVVKDSYIEVLICSKMELVVSECGNSVVVVMSEVGKLCSVVGCVISLSVFMVSSVTRAINVVTISGDVELKTAAVTVLPSVEVVRLSAVTVVVPSEVSVVEYVMFSELSVGRLFSVLYPLLVVVDDSV